MGMQMVRCLRIIVWMPLIIVAFSTPALLWGQATGTMSGYVKDPSGASVAQAKVTATLVERGTTFTTQTDSEGFYNFPALDPGTYTLTVQRAGFNRYTQEGLVLTVRQNLRVDATLAVGSVTESVTVTAAAPLVDTASSTVSGLVDDRRIVDLPLNGRNVIGLAEIVPGVLSVSAPESLTDTRSGPIMNVNGGRDNSNLFTFDGAYFLNPSRNTGMNYPPPDAVQEFRIQTANFDAQYGRNTGSQTAVVSKAGTNSFHGDVWEFLRNDDLNARNFFAPTVPADKENQFGAAVGGPIRKSKLFYFGSFEGLIDRPQGVTNVATVPTSDERSGNFTADLPGTVLVDPTNPVTGAPLTTPSGAPCVANNIIDPSCLSPVSTNLLPYIPQSPTGTLVSLAAQPVNKYTYFGRLDANLSPRHVLFGHFFLDHNTFADASDGGNVTTYVHYNSGAQTLSVTLGDTFSVNPSLVNQATVEYLRTTTLQYAYPSISNASIGMNMADYSNPSNLNLDVGGVLLMGSNGTSSTVYLSNGYSFRDDMTWIKGRHTIKFGGEELPLHFIQRWIGPPSFYFNGGRSGDPFADFMLGAYYQMSVFFGQAQNDDLTASPAAYIQDQFKMSPRLTLTYGLRWEPNLLWHDKYNRVNTFRPGVQSTVVPDAPPGILFPGDPGIPRALVPGDYHNFAPRVGFAWDVFGNGKTSVRGAYGVFFEQANADTMAQQNPPYTGVDYAYNGVWSDPFGSVGQTPPPVVTSGHFGCAKISTPPFVNCPLFPLPVLAYFVDGSFRTPYWQGWNFDVQRQITPSTMLELSYVGKDGIKLNNLRDFNPAQFTPGTTYNAATGAETTVSSLENVNDRVLYEPGIIAPTAWTLGNDYRSWYHSFQAHLIRRLSNGLSIDASYTLAKAIDMDSSDNEGGGTTNDPFDLRTLRGRANWDRRHAFVASYVWSPPVHSSERWKDVLLGRWTFSGVTTIQSGAPTTFYSGTDIAVNGTTAYETSFRNGQAIAFAHPNRGAMVNEFFNTSAFVSPICTFTPQAFDPQVIEQENCTPDGIPYNLLGQYGQSGRNILSGPAYVNTDFAILKEFPFRERYRVQFRSEFFNIFNQVNFNSVDSTQTDATFGQILGANSGRVIQFALKFFW